MILHQPRKRPESWGALRSRVRFRWIVPFIAFEWVWEWVAFALSNWRFLEVLEYLGSFSVLIGVIFYFTESGDRVKQRHYQAWQVINTAQGKGGSGGRIEALQELNEDGVPLVGVDASSAFLQGIRLEHASLIRADFNAADLRGAQLEGDNFGDADLHFANFRAAKLAGSSFAGANLADADLLGAELNRADLNDADLTDADLRSADLAGVKWEKIRSIKKANIMGVRNAPEGFVAWAMKNGALQSADDQE